MFRKSKKDKSDGVDPLFAPNINDDNDAMWFNPKSSTTGGGGLNDMAHPGMGIPPGAPPTLRMSTSPNLSSVRKSTKTSSSSGKGRYSANDLVAAISINDWSTVLAIIDKDPKVASKNAHIQLKGQKTEGNALLLLVVSNPPVEVVQRMIKAYPSGASNTDRQGERTALHWACIANANPLILEALTNANAAACRAQDKKFARTPLHYLVVIAEDPEQVQVLMEAERRASLIKDLNHKTPIDLAHDSTNPAKVDIIAALQRKRSSTINMFGALKSGSKSRTASPGKYKSADYTAEAPSSPVRYGSMPLASQSPGKYSSRESSRTPKSPGKYRDKEGSSRGRRSTDAEGSSRGRRSTDAEGSSRRHRSTDGKRRSTDEREGSSKPRRNRSSRGDHRESKGDHRKRRSSRADGGMAKDSKAIQDVVVSDIEDSGEFVIPPPLSQSQSMSGQSISSIPPSRSPSRSISRSVSPMVSRSRSPVPSISPPPIVHGSPIASTGPSAGMNSARTSNANRRSNQNIPPPIVHGSPIASTGPSAGMNSARTSNASRRSNQNIAADMNGEMRTLREKLERKKRAVENKDQEIAQIDDQIEDNKDAIAALYERAQNGGTAAPVNDRKLSEKRDKVQRLKDKIAELQAELRKEERDLKRMEGAGENMGAARIQDEILSKEEEKSSLQFVKEALAQERMAALRDVENVESEIKSLETILMLAQGDDNIG